jgi:hypothetical protein
MLADSANILDARLSRQNYYKLPPFTNSVLKGCGQKLAEEQTLPS